MGFGLVQDQPHQPIFIVRKMYRSGQIEHYQVGDYKPSTTFFRIDHYQFDVEPYHSHHFFKLTFKQ